MDNLEANIMDKSMRSVFVGNIPYEATEEKLKDIFGEVGQVLSFKLVFDRETGKPKGYGFCEYRDQETALSAMRNLNGYEIGGRNLRVDNACTEKSRMEMQNLLNQPAVENPYGEPIQAEKAPEAISKAVASLPPEQMFELMKQMKLCIQNNPTEARQMLLQNPQLAYALLQAQVVMRIIDPVTASTLLYPPNQVPPTLPPKEKPNTALNVPISREFLPPPPAPVQPPIMPMRQEFQPVPAPVMHPNANNQNSVFSNQDIDLRSLDPRAGDPRLIRMGDQDMRTLPGQLPNPLPPPLVENFNRDHRDPRDLRDPRGGPGNFPNDPRQQQQRIDPRQKNMPMQQQQQLPAPLIAPQPVRAPPPPVIAQQQQQNPIMVPQPAPPASAVAPPVVPVIGPQQGVAPPAPRSMPVGPPPPAVGGGGGVGAPPPVPVAAPVVAGGGPPTTSAGAGPGAAAGAAAGPSIGPAGASDQEKAALIMQVLQLSDEQIAMLPPEQRNSILVLKEQIAKSAHR